MFVFLFFFYGWQLNSTINEYNIQNYENLDQIRKGLLTTYISCPIFPMWLDFSHIFWIQLEYGLVLKYNMQSLMNLSCFIFLTKLFEKQRVSFSQTGPQIYVPVWIKLTLC